MTTAKRFKTLEHEPDYFGGCPECGGDNGYFNIGRDHYVHCQAHKTVWCIGSNLFSSWREETESDWQNNREKFADYTPVEPRHFRTGRQEHRNTARKLRLQERMRNAPQPADWDLPF